MDCSTRTALRPGLAQAARDVLEDFQTPGKQLLIGIQAAEASRKQRYDATVGAKMLEAKHKLATLQPAHAPRGDAALGTAPRGEVETLLPDARPEQAGMVGVSEMLASRAARHAAALARFAAASDTARKQAGAEAAAAASTLATCLGQDEAETGQQMELLQPSRVMLLNAAEFDAVWSRIEAAFPARKAALDALESDLASVEAARRAASEAALRDLGAALEAIAYIDPGQAQRILEAEALAINKALLADRRAACEMLKSAHAGEAQRSRELRQRWEAARDNWRTLRSKHAVETFVTRLSRPRYAEPRKRMALFARLTADIDQAASQLAAHLLRGPKVLPPQGMGDAARGWRDEADRLCNEWESVMASGLADLKAHEDKLEAEVQGEMVRLREEVIGYDGLTPKEVEELMTSRARPAAEARRAAAAALLSAASTYCRRRADEWCTAAGAIGSWVFKLAGLLWDRNTRHSRDEAGVRAALREAADLFSHQHAEREAAFASAVDAVRSAPSERALDAAVASALSWLQQIEAGYRGYNAAAMGIVRAHPGTVQKAQEAYAAGIEALLGVSPAPDSLSASALSTCDENHCTGRLVQLPSGKGYREAEDIFDALVLAARTTSDRSGEQAATVPPAQQQQLPALAPAVEPPSKPAAPPKPAGRMTKAEIAAAQAAAEAAAAAAAVAAEAAAAAAAAAEAAANTCPVSSVGGKLCAEVPLPGNELRAALQTIQVGMLSEMEAFSGRVQGAAAEWADQQETELTEDLDARLRAHRPRAGRVEEDDRAARSDELVSQRRRAERHMSDQSKAVKRQQAGADEGLKGLAEAVAAACARLRGCERLMGQALSLRGIDACWREAQALKVKLERQLLSKVEALLGQSAAGCDEATAANRRFEAENLKAFDEGGRMAPENIDAYRRGIAGVDHHVAAQKARQSEALKAAEAAAVTELASALAYVESLLPSHREDMALLELVDKAMAAAKLKTAGALDRNRADAEAIEQALCMLRALIEAGDDQALEAAATAGAGNLAGQIQQQHHEQQQSGSIANVPLQPSRRCVAMLQVTDSLRLRLLRQAQALEHLASTGLTAAAIDVSLPALQQDSDQQQQQEPLPDGSVEPPSAVSTATQQAAGATGTAPPAAPPGKGAASQPGAKGTGAKPGSPTKRSGSGDGSSRRSTRAGDAKGSSSSGAIQAGAQPQGPSLFTEVAALIDASTAAVQEAAEAYFAKKVAGRPIRYPARIPATLEELLAACGDTLSDLRKQLQGHVDSGVLQLRIQVITASRLLECLPAAAVGALVQHLLASAAASHAELAAVREARQSELNTSLELNKRQLHPSMLHPGRQTDLDTLKTAEASRQQAAQSAAQSAARDAAALVCRGAPAAGAAVQGLAKLLLQLLDGFVMPADLPPEPPAMGTPVQRRNLLQLERLAMAQREAVPVGGSKLPAAALPAVPAGGATGGAEAATPPAAPPAAGKAGAGKTGAAAGTKPGSPTKGARAAAQQEAAAAPAVSTTGAAGRQAAGSMQALSGQTVAGRPFALGTWDLPSGHLDAAGLGWGGGVHQASSGESGAAAAAAAAAAAGPAPASTAAAATAAPASARGARRPGSAGAKAAAEAAAAASAECKVTAVDTPCARACVLAHRSAVGALEAGIGALAASDRRQISEWEEQERRWAAVWERTLADVEAL